MTVDWKELHRQAVQASQQAYAPYSGFRVGAAGLVDDGRIISGCNVENASYGLSLCAECGLVSSLHASGGGHLVAVVVVDTAGDLLMPCGRCRQLLLECGGDSLMLGSDEGPVPVSSLLPYAFSNADLTD